MNSRPKSEFLRTTRLKVAMWICYRVFAVPVDVRPAFFKDQSS